MIIKQSQNPESIGDTYNNELLKNQNNKSLFNVDRRCQWGARFSWISSLERPQGSGGIIATKTRIGSDEREIAVVKDSFREQIVASILILLFWRQYLAFSDWSMTFFILNVPAKF